MGLGARVAEHLCVLAGCLMTDLPVTSANDSSSSLSDSLFGGRFSRWFVRDPSLSLLDVASILSCLDRFLLNASVLSPNRSLSFLCSYISLSLSFGLMKCVYACIFLSWF